MRSVLVGRARGHSSSVARAKGDMTHLFDASFMVQLFGQANGFFLPSFPRVFFFPSAEIREHGSALGPYYY
jgi:hypothetical protein